MQPTLKKTITRRQFIEKSLIATGAVAVLDQFSFSRSMAQAALVDPNDSALASSEVTFPSVDGANIGGYLARPNDENAHAAILVVHAWDGMNDHIRDVARRLAKAGYVALAPDLLSRRGGSSSFTTREYAIAAGRKLTNDEIVNDLSSGIRFLKSQKFVGEKKLGIIGFCWGGAKALLFTTRTKELAASVIYYGDNPKNLDEIKNTTAPVLGHYGGEDARVTSGVPDLDAAMKKFGKSFEYKIYPGAPHSFNSDQSPRSFRPEAAKEAWTRTLEFYDKHLRQ